MERSRFWPDGETRDGNCFNSVNKKYLRSLMSVKLTLVPLSTAATGRQRASLYMVVVT